MNSLFIAYENDESCHGIAQIIGSPAFISFYCVYFVSFYFFLFFIFFADITYGYWGRKEKGGRKVKDRDDEILGLGFVFGG